MKYLFTILILTIPLLGFSQWIDITVDTTKFYKVVKFLNQNDGLIMGDSSTILKTSDGGNTWTFISCSINTNINDFQYINDTLVYAYGTDRIIKSDDKGDTWSLLNMLTSYSAKTYFINQTIGFSAASHKLLKTYNAGLSWDTVWNHNMQYGSGLITDIKFYNDTIGFACGSRYIPGGGGWYGIILRTYDSGNNWNEVYNNPPWGTSIDKIDILNNIVYGIADIGYLLKSLDSGINWTGIIMNLDPYFSSTSTLNSIYFSNNDTAYIASSPIEITPEYCLCKRKILRSTDGCQTWITQYLDATDLCQDKLLNSIFFCNDTTGFSVGYHKILRTDNCGGNINILDTIQYQNIVQLKTGVNLLFNIYPNPTENYVHIECKTNEFFEIELTNIIGELLYKSILVQTNHTIDMTKFCSGIYFIKLKSGLNTMTEKLIKR